MAKIEAIIDYIIKHDNYIVTCHESPDGDALAAEYALARGLQIYGKNVRIINSDATPGKYDFLDSWNMIVQYQSSDDLPEELDKWTLIIVDTELSNIGSIKEIIPPRAVQTLIIDHHNFGDETAPYTYLNPDAGSSSEIIYTILEKLGVEITLDIGIAIYTGIVYDTGFFAYPKTNAYEFHIAENLVNIGVDPSKIYSLLAESKSIESIILQTLVHQNMKLHYDQRVAVQYMSRKTLLDSGAKYEESQEIVNFPLQSQKVRASVFFKEDTTGLLRCSIRSKGEVNCAEVARSFNGGGHKTAAGFKCYEPFEDIKPKVLDMLGSYFT
ncbi:DHH family phosphoesterase [Spirochaeta isovalerica]|uniref:Phosphoesterase RecJ-like protein n=1 Tax=Spirochaeta isovalerica TaxID=150 RepID=A0A841R7V3_9SPIO|nr:bifunctional oligoribonuclease/PAP phosphatase NrnA [Spirochaeta isovalerica]MBB6478562.1 phosphoesterase RecJ-like protein [Spirochaeta isovalerica]